jgi:hypothetical protein
VTDIFIEGGRALLGGEIHDTSLQIAGGKISAVGSEHGRGSLGLDASDLKVLPGIVDLHGDAFERQMMPRPGVDFPVDVALIDSDRQVVANGITTVYHGTTSISTPKPRSRNGFPMAASTCSRSMTTWIPRSPASTNRGSAPEWWSAAVFRARSSTGWSNAWRRAATKCRHRSRGWRMLRGLPM